MPNQQICDPKTIELFLDDKLNPQQQLEFSQHLENCTQCQDAVDTAAAEKSFWDEAVSRLGTPNRISKSQPNSSAPIKYDVDMLTTDEGPSEHSFTSLLNSLAPTDDPEMLGRIGEYEISGIVGIGGMGSVLKGFDRSLMRVVAIKVMAPHLADKGSARKRFEREARAAAAISHDNVCDIYRVDALNGLPYLVMPFARGPSLQKRIDDGGPLSTTEVVLVGKQIAAGLSAAHEQGLVHRDIKPANILLNDGIERILITDFGVARAIDDASMTQTGLIAGTPQFMSPEQARGEVVDQRSDLFSLGALLYTACTGRPPFRAEAPFGILQKINQCEPRSIQEINPEIPTWLVAIINKLLEKRPSERFESAKEVSTLLEQCLAHLRQPNQISLPVELDELTAPRLKVVKPTTATKPDSHLLRWLAVAGSLLAITALGIIGFLQITQAPNIAGNWQGEQWKAIDLKSVEEASDWYAGKFIDANGNDGAIHLEWSRLERRYKGRWSVDEGNSGTIVLRTSDSSIRGAIMLDSETSGSFESDRLRDFVWQPGSSKILRTDDSSPSPVTLEPNTRIIASPVEGNIAELGIELKSNGRVKKGDLIAVIEPSGKDNLRSGLRALKDALQEKLDAAETKVNAYQANKVGFEDAMKFSSNATSAKVAAAKSKVESLTQQMKGYQAKESQAKQSFEHTSKLFEKGFANEQMRQKSKAEWEVATAELESWKHDIEAAEQSLKADETEAAAKNSEMQAKVENADVTLQDARQNVAAIKKELAEIATKLEQSNRVKILAPGDGELTLIKIQAVGEYVQKGHELVRMRVNADETMDSLSTTIPLSSAEAPRYFNLKSPAGGIVSRIASGLREGKPLNKGDYILEIRPAPQTLSGIKSSMREIRSQLLSSQSKVELAEKQLANLTEAKELAIQTAEEKVKIAETTLQSKSELISGLEANETKLKADLERVSKLHDKALVTEKELGQVTQQWKSAKSVLDSATLDLKGLKHDLNIKKLEIATVRNEAQAKIDQAEQERKDSKILTDELEQTLYELQSEFDQSARCRIHAPVDGTIIEWLVEPQGNQVVNEGDLLLRIKLNEKPRKPSPDRPEPTPETAKPTQPKELAGFSVESIPVALKFAADLEARVRQSKTTLASLETEINRMDQTLESQKKQVDLLKQQREKLAQIKAPKNELTELELRFTDQTAVLQASHAEKKKLENERLAQLADFNSAIQQLETSTRIMTTELKLAQEQSKLARGVAKQLRLGYEMGDASYIEVQQAELRASRLDSNVNGLSELLDYLNRIQPNGSVGESGE